MPLEIALIYGAGIGFIGLASYLFSKAICSQPENEVTRKRSMSFSSKTLIEGSFPSEATVAPPIINILLLFRKNPSDKALLEICERLRSYDRFRCAVKKVGSEWRFVDSTVSAEDHIVNYEVDSETELLATVDTVCNDDLGGSEDRPLWVMCRYNNKGPGVSAVLVRIHHVIGDGIALVGSMGKLFEDEAGQPVNMDIPGKMRGGSGGGSSDPCGTFCKFFKSFAEVASLAVSRPDSTIAFTCKDRTRLAMHCQRHKTVIMPTLKLDFVKEIKNKAAVTINDVLLSAIAGAFRRYCEYRGDEVLLKAVQAGTGAKDIQCRALLPVAFPRSEQELQDPALAMRNKWSFVSAPLPVGVGSTAKERLSAVNAFTAEMKKSPTALVQLWMQNNFLAVLPTFLVRKTAHDVFSRHSLVFSNVPGPPDTVFFGGELLMGMQTIFPNILPQVLIVSYGGQIFFSLNVDVDQVEDPEKIADFFLEEMRDLAESYGVDTSPLHMMSPRSAGGVFSLVAAV